MTPNSLLAWAGAIAALSGAGILFSLSFTLLVNLPSTFAEARSKRRATAAVQASAHEQIKAKHPTALSNLGKNN
jgi:hypothetical protein